jgi:hypothetical protein
MAKFWKTRSYLVGRHTPLTAYFMGGKLPVRTESSFSLHCRRSVAMGSIRTFAARRFDDRKADADMAGGKDCSQPLADLDFPPVVRRCGNTPGTYRTLAMSRDAATQLPESGY